MTENYDSGSTRFVHVLQSLPKVLFGVAVVVLVIYAVLLIGEIAFGHNLYYSTYSALLNFGSMGNIYFVKAIAVIFTAAWFITFPMAIRHFLLLKRRKAAVALGALYFCWYLALAGINAFQAESAFNPLYGEANYTYYKSPNGLIELFPKDYKFHPTLGVELKVVTPEVMTEYKKQNPQTTQSTGKLPSNSSAHLGNPDYWEAGYGSYYEIQGLRFAVNKVWREDDQYRAIVAIYNSEDKNQSHVIFSRSYLDGTYLVDRSGKRYRAQSFTADLDEDGTRRLAVRENMSVVIIFGGRVEALPDKLFVAGVTAVTLFPKHHLSR